MHPVAKPQVTIHAEFWSGTPPVSCSHTSSCDSCCHSAQPASSYPYVPTASGDSPPFPVQSWCNTKDPICGQGFAPNPAGLAQQFAAAVNCKTQSCPHRLYTYGFPSSGETVNGGNFLANNAFGNVRLAHRPPTRSEAGSARRSAWPWTQYPGRQELGRAGLGDLLDLAALAQGELRRPASSSCVSPADWRQARSRAPNAAVSVIPGLTDLNRYLTHANLVGGMPEASLMLASTA